MANDFIKYAFTTGELSEQLYGRTDLQQYDLGLKQAQNWFVDYRGGLSNRAGFEFCDHLAEDDKAIKLYSFDFSPRRPNKYLLIFGHHYLRFMQTGAYVLEATKTVTAITNSGVVTAAGHGYSGGDWVKLTTVVGPDNINTRTFQIGSVTTNTFKLRSLPTLDDIVLQGAYVSGGVVQRIYTVTTPYAADELAELTLKQRRDYIRMTHPDYKVKNLIRNGATNWTIENEVFGTKTAAPTGLTAVGSDSGASGTLFTVTAVLDDDEETVMAEPYRVTGVAHIGLNPQSITYNWDIHPKARSYNVYRGAIVISSDDLTKGMPMGFIGNTIGTQLLDSNLVPDYTKTPPVNNNPFAPGSILSVTMTTGGTGHDDTTTVTISDPDGIGFVGYTVIDQDGAVVGVGIIDGGTGYTSPSVVFGGAGTGAVATVTKSALDNLYPSVSEIFQQRQLYAGSDNDPLKIWGSRPKQYSNFDFSNITIASDSYEFDVDAQRIAPILHLEALRGGLIVMSQDQIWQLTGGQETSVTPLNALADPQTYTGSSPVRPLRVGNDLLYIEASGYGVYQLTYNEYAKIYTSDDKTVLSRHLFGPNLEIIAWASCPNPFKMVYAIRADGRMLAFTFMKAGKDDSLFAWTPFTTKGYFEDIASIFENGYDVPYVVTKRYINGRWTKFIERMKDRNFNNIDVAFVVDAGLQYTPNRPGGTLYATSATGTAVFTANPGSFPSGCVGWVIHAGLGRAVVTSRISSSQVNATFLSPILDLVPETDLPAPITSWSVDAPVTELNGFWHLEGETLSVLYDGNVLQDAVVNKGKITLPFAATRVAAGLGYTARAETLPPSVSDAVIEAKKKRNVQVAARLHESKGLKYGSTERHMYRATERTTENWNIATRLFTGQQVVFLSPEWNLDSTLTFIQDLPLPANVLALVISTEVGDDSN